MTLDTDSQPELLTIPVRVGQNNLMNNTKRLTGIRVVGLLNNIELFGHERANIEVFRTLRDCGASVTVGVNSIKNGGHVRERLEQLEFPMFSIPFGCQWSKQFFLRQPLLLPNNIRRMFTCSRILRDMVTKIGATHVHIGNPLVYSFVAPYLTANRSLKFVFRMGDIPPIESRPNLAIWRSCYRRACHVVANSQFVQRSIYTATNGAGFVNMIHNYSPVRPADRIASKELQTTAGDFRVLYVGQISEHKGVHLLLDSAIELCNKYPHCVFDIVGGSRHTQNFEQSLADRVANSGFSDRIRFHGRVSDPTAFYRQASILAVPSVFEEPAANVAVEAKSFGVPSVVFPSGGLPELVSHGQTGWVCREKSAAALTQQLAHCIENAEACHSMRAACEAESEQNFGYARFADQWSSVYAA